MIRVQGALVFTLLLSAVVLQGCAKHKKGHEGIQFENVAEYTNHYNQARIMLIVYHGDADYENIESYVETLGCGMLYAYFYPGSTPRSTIPQEEFIRAKSFLDAQEILFNGEGYSRWHYAAQCLAAIPVVTDCQEMPFSTNCR